VWAGIDIVGPAHTIKDFLPTEQEALQIDRHHTASVGDSAVTLPSEQKLIHDPVEVERSIAILLSRGDVIECRIPKTEGQGTVSGYFDDPTALKQAVLACNSAGIYTTLNLCKPELLARCANRLKPYAKETTKDHEILARRLLLLDFDPVRSSGISASDEEHVQALTRAREVRQMLEEEGWPPGILADSGNGGHVVYGLDLPNDDAATKLIENVLKGLALRFDDNRVKLDQTVFNASRIVILWGTVARKGDHILERPHRLSRILETVEKLEPVPLKLLEEHSTAAAPVQAKSEAVSIGVPPPPSEISKVEAFIHKHLKVLSDPTPYKDGRKWRVVCPFNSEHDNAAAFESDTGKLGFKCLHDSCRGKRGQHVRELFGDPLSPDEESSDEEGDLIEPPEGAAMVKQIEDILHKYLVLPAPAYLPVAIWIIATHAAQLFDCFPYLAVLSPTKRCGKTRLLEVIETLAHKPWRGTAPSPAALYRMIERGPTLLLDEIEGLKNAAKSETAQALVSILNAGHRKGAFVPRCVGGGNNEVQEFHTYGPKVFCAIGKLPDTLMDRSIIIGMQRRTKAQSVSRFLISRATAEGKAVHAGIVRYVRAYAPVIAEAHRHTIDQDLDYLEDRDADLWMSLIAVCAATDADRLEELKHCAIVLSQGKASEEADDPFAVKLLRDIREVWPMKGDNDPESQCPTATLVEKLKGMADSRWAGEKYTLTGRKLADLLRPFEVEPKDIRVDEKTLRGYEYRPLATAFERYLAQQSATSTTSQ
jgi:hypothetical protein